MYEGRLELNYREADIWEYVTSWECKTCSGRKGPLWEIRLEHRIGRRLTSSERRELRANRERRRQDFFNTALSIHNPDAPDKPI